MTEARSRAEKKQHTRALLLAAARQRVAASGFRSLAVRDVAREAGIVPTAFYRHFADVEELAAAVADEAVGALDDLVDELTRGAPDAERWSGAVRAAAVARPAAWPALAGALLDRGHPVHGRAIDALDRARRLLGIALSRDPDRADAAAGEVDALADVVVTELLRGALETAGAPGAARLRVVLDGPARGPEGR